MCEALQESLAIGSRSEWIPPWIVPSEGESPAIPLQFDWIADATEGVVQEMVGKEGESKCFGVAKYFTEHGIGVTRRQYRALLYRLPTPRGPNAVDETSVVQA